MEVKLLGSVTVGRLEQPEKAYFSIEVTPSPKVKEVNFVLSRKANPHIVPPAMDMVAMLSHPPNQSDSMVKDVA